VTSPHTPCSTNDALQTFTLPSCQVDLSKITPTGKGGRITKDDLINYMNNDMGPAAEVKYPVYSSPPEQSQPPPPPVVTIPTAHFYNATTYMADTQASTSDN